MPAAHAPVGAIPRSPRLRTDALSSLRRITAAAAAATLTTASLTVLALAPAAADPSPAHQAQPAAMSPAAGVAPAAPSADQGERVILEQGHTDLWHVTAEGDALSLDLREDITGSHVHHSPEDVELHVKSAARTRIPDGWPAAGEAFLLPLSQDQQLLWPGWDTQAIAGSGFDDRIELRLQSVDGPGQVHVFSQSGFGSVQPLLAGDATELTAGAVLPQEYPAHTHANWAFTEPGVYRLTVVATGTKDGTQVDSAPQTYTVTVGDEFRGKADAEPAPVKPEPAPTPEPAPEKPTPEPAPAPKPEPEPAPSPEPAPAPEKPAPEDSTPIPAPPSTPSSQAPGAEEPAEQPAAARLVLDQGHTDIWHVAPKGDELLLDLREDITGQHVTHAPESVELHVKDGAYTEVPTGWPGEGSGYLLPMSQDQELLWPGWDTQDLSGSGFDEAVQLRVTGVDGPGTIHLFSQDSFGKVQPLLENGMTALRPGAVRDQAFPAHTHANWVFTKPGVYHVTVQAHGTKDGTAVSSQPQTYTFTVGDAFRGKGDAKNSEKIAYTPPAPSAPSGGEDDSSVSADGGAPASPASSPAPMPRETMSGSGSVGASDGGGSGVCIAEETVRAATADEVKKAKAGKDSAAAPSASSSAPRATGSYTVPRNTHSHPNWVFSKPGNYALNIRQTATLKSGQKVSGTTTLTFSVGPHAKGAASGHFDVGTRIENGKLVPSVKDDRTSPATWVDPSSVTFALGESAKATAPAGLEFIAPKGAEVYMVPGTQIPGAPWVGANTMHESVIAETTGEVTWELTGASGPGNVGVFTSGNFGTLVGETWFTASSGDSDASAGAARSHGSSAIAKNAASAAPGQVFTDGDAFKVKEITGHTASGEECDPSAAEASQLAHTGAEIAPYALGALLATIIGGGLLIRHRHHS